MPQSGGQSLEEYAALADTLLVVQGMELPAHSQAEMQWKTCINRSIHAHQLHERRLRALCRLCAPLPPLRGSAASALSACAGGAACGWGCSGRHLPLRPPPAPPVQVLAQHSSLVRGLLAAMQEGAVVGPPQPQENGTSGSGLTSGPLPRGGGSSSSAHSSLLAAAWPPEADAENGHTSSLSGGVLLRIEEPLRGCSVEAVITVLKCIYLPGGLNLLSWHGLIHEFMLTW